MDFLPIAIRISNILIVGGGKVATHKAQILNRFTDKVTVIAPEVSSEIKALPFKVIERQFEESDLDAFLNAQRSTLNAQCILLLFVCTGDHELNHRIKAIAAKRGILTSVCDDTAYCDFISPAISRQADDNLTIAVGSDGKDVKRSIRVRNRINELIKDNILDLS